MDFKSLLFCSFLAVLLMFNTYCHAVPRDCDKVKCIIAVKDYLIDLRHPFKAFSCKSLLNSTSSWCSDYCMRKYFPESVKVASKNSHNFADYCEKNLSHSNANWSCIVRHSFQLLTCYFNISSITTNDVRESMLSKQLCRKSLEYPKCPSSVLLSECGSQSVKVMTDLFNFVSNYLGFPTCGETEKTEVSNLPVHYHLKAEHMTVAKCFDKHPTFPGNCFGQIIQDEIDLHNYLCGDYDEINNCINFFYHKYGKECQSITTFSHIFLPKLFSLGGFKCKPNLQLQDLSTQSSPNFEDLNPFIYEKSSGSYLNDLVNPKDEVDTVNSKDEIHDAEELNSDFSHQSWALSTGEPSPSSAHAHREMGFETNLKIGTAVEKVNRNNQNETDIVKTVDSDTVDVNYLKTSSAIYLNCDKISFATVCFIGILLNIIFS